jgi:hypothetical protein
VKNTGAHAQQIHFLIHYKGHIAGIISGGSAVYSTTVRDAFFQITKENRDRVLNGIVDNTVFRLENHEKNLATRVLSIWRKVAARLWEDLYGVTVYGFETFVEEEELRKGALYKADNWTFLGETVGNTGQTLGGKMFARRNVVPKLVYCKWRDGCSKPIESEYQSSWRSTNPEEKTRKKMLATKRAGYLGKNFYCVGKAVEEFDRLVLNCIVPVIPFNQPQHRLEPNAPARLRRYWRPERRCHRADAIVCRP